MTLMEKLNPASRRTILLAQAFFVIVVVFVFVVVHVISDDSRNQSLFSVKTKAFTYQTTQCEDLWNEAHKTKEKVTLTKHWMKGDDLVLDLDIGEPKNKRVKSRLCVITEGGVKIPSVLRESRYYP